jgi:anti-sigma factor RsiW
MKNHQHFEELLPLYAAGSLSEQQRTEVKQHLDACAACQEDLAMWKAVTNEITRSNTEVSAPTGLPQKTLAKIHAPNPLTAALRQSWQLLIAQSRLVQSELWPVSALVMGIGILVAVISKQIVVVYLLSPMVAASALAIVYGPDRDPAMELSSSTPTSAWKILFARLSMVSCYNLLLGLAASFALLFIVPIEMLGSIILGWIAPLAFLSALALLISIWLGTGSAISISYSLWMVQFLPLQAAGLYTGHPAWSSFLNAYKNFWHNPMLLFALALLLLVAALWSADKPVSYLDPAKL